MSGFPSVPTDPPVLSLRSVYAADHHDEVEEEEVRRELPPLNRRALYSDQQPLRRELQNVEEGQEDGCRSHIIVSNKVFIFSSGQVDGG